MTNKNIIALYNDLKAINLKGVKFSYGIAKNLSILEIEIKAIEKTTEFTPDFKNYEKERIELASKHAKKDEEGKVVIENGRYILEDKDTADQEFKELREKYKEALEERDQQLEDYKALLEEESSVELFKIKLSDVPEDISTEQMTSIFAIIEE